MLPLSKVHEQQPGRTSRTIHFLSFPQSTQQRIAKRCNELFSVYEKDVPNLDTILTSIPPEVILRKQRLLVNPSMKQAMLFPQPAQAGDAFYQVLNGLARKLPHDRTVYLKSVTWGFTNITPALKHNLNSSKAMDQKPHELKT
ncbi:hypothetical protein NC651_034259, partial [Populus alba x Populus x berolinensis]